MVRRRSARGACRFLGGGRGGSGGGRPEVHRDFWTEVKGRSGGDWPESHEDFWTEVERGRAEVGPNSMGTFRRRSRGVGRRSARSAWGHLDGGRWGSGGGRPEVHGDFWTEVEGGRAEVGPKCMGTFGRTSRGVGRRSGRSAWGLLDGGRGGSGGRAANGRRSGRRSGGGQGGGRAELRG